MSPIKNVAVLGASGNVGVPVVKELLKAGFHVTALSRTTSNATFPADVTVKKVDYSSPASVQAALAGQDAVVSLVASAATGTQKPLVDAAIAAGVKRFIPSEFGINTRQVEGTPIGKILGGKVGTWDYLVEKGKENPGFTYTGVTTGNFFDWGLRFTNGGIDFNTKTARVIDSGNEKYYTSNLPFIGRALASILGAHYDDTANKYLAIASFNTSANEIIAAVEELTGLKLTVNHLDSKEVQKQGEEKLAKGDFSAFINFLQVWTGGDGAGHALKPEDSANKLLGLEEESLKESVKEWLVETGRL